MMSDLEENEVKTGPAVPPPVVEEAALAEAPAMPVDAPPAKKGLWAAVRSAPKTPPLIGNPLHPVRARSSR